MNARSAGLLLLLAVPASGQDGGLFWDVVDVLGESYYDRDFRREELPALVDRVAPGLERCETAAGERAVVQELLEEIPASHLSLLSRSLYRSMLDELGGRGRPSVGFQVVELEGRYYVDWLYEGGPGETAGLRRGDEVITLDGAPPRESDRLDWRSDDAALPDPPLHGILCETGESVEVEYARRAGQTDVVDVAVARYSGMDAARDSARLFERGGRRYGYVHIWFVPLRGAPELLRKLVEGPFAACDALIFDLRGRGGSAAEVPKLVKMLRDWGRPLVLLTNRTTRSAKEVIAYEVQSSGSALIVGERTAGAVIPATFREVGQDGVLMFPSFTLGRYTKVLEGDGVAPDIPVEDHIAYSAGRDPILEAGKVALDVWCHELASWASAR